MKSPFREAVKVLATNAVPPLATRSAVIATLLKSVLYVGSSLFLVLAVQNQFWEFWEWGWLGKYDADWDGLGAVLGIGAPVATAWVAIKTIKWQAAQFEDARKTDAERAEKDRSHEMHMALLQHVLPERLREVSAFSTWHEKSWMAAGFYQSSKEEHADLGENVEDDIREAKRDDVEKAKQLITELLQTPETPKTLSRSCYYQSVRCSLFLTKWYERIENDSSPYVDYGVMTSVLARVLRDFNESCQAELLTETPFMAVEAMRIRAEIEAEQEFDKWLSYCSLNEETVHSYLVLTGECAPPDLERWWLTLGDP